MAGPTSLTPAPAQTVTAPTPLAAGVHTQPSFDPLELLPRAAAERLRLLRLRRDDAHLLIPPFEDVRTASLERVSAERALKQLTDHPQDFGFGLKPDDPQVIAAAKTLARATDELQRLTALQATRTAAWQAASQALAACETWLRSGRPHGTTLEDWDGPEPQMSRAEKGLLDAIENRRRKVREMRADLAIISAAPFPSAWAKERMREQITALAQQGAPSVSRLVAVDGPVEFQTQRLSSEVHGAQRSLAFATVPDALALTCWLHREALIERLDAEIDAEADDKAALTHDQRQQQEAQLLRDVLAVERDEATLVFQAQSQGLPVEHRADIDPVALLGVALVPAQRSDLPPRTTMGLAWDLVRGR